MFENNVRKDNEKSKVDSKVEQYYPLMSTKGLNERTGTFYIVIV